MPAISNIMPFQVHLAKLDHQSFLIPLASLRSWFVCITKLHRTPTNGKRSSNERQKYLYCSTHVCFCVWSYFTYATASGGGEGWHHGQTLPRRSLHICAWWECEKGTWNRSLCVSTWRFANSGNAVDRADGGEVDQERARSQAEKAGRTQRSETSSGCSHALLAWPRGRAKRHRRFWKWLFVLVFVCVRGRCRVLLGIIALSYDKKIYILIVTGFAT